jgi:hypothetical protein
MHMGKQQARYEAVETTSSSDNDSPAQTRYTKPSSASTVLRCMKPFAVCGSSFLWGSWRDRGTWQDPFEGRYTCLVCTSSAAKSAPVHDE